MSTPRPTTRRRYRFPAALTGTAALAGTAVLTAFAPPALAVPQASTPTVAVAPSPPPDPVRTQLQAALDAVVDAGATGLTVRVDTDQRAYRLAGGLARRQPIRTMRPEAKLRVGSITKSFVSTVTLQLAAEGRLRLDDTVEHRLPGLVPGGADITVRQLLNHTSGLFNYTDDAEFVARLFADPLRPVTPLELVAVSTAHPPVFAPGTSWSYSNTNYIVIGLILERVTHQKVSTLLERRVIRPLGLRHTSFPERSPRIPGYHAHGYLPPALTGEDAYHDYTHVTPTWAWAAGALVSNVDDLHRYYRALLGGRLLPAAQLAEMKTMVELDGLGYGLGLYRVDTPCGSFWGHDGGVPGYVTIAWNDETGHRGVTIGLTTQPDEAIGQAFDELLAVAACRALGQSPTPSSANRTASSDEVWSRRVDRAPAA